MGYRTGSQHLVWAISEPVTRSRGLGPAEGSALGSPAPLVRSHPFPAASGRRRRRVFLKWGNHPRGPAEKRVAGGGGRAPRRAAESEPRVFQGTRGAGARSASGRRRAGSRWETRRPARPGPRGRREGAGRGRCGVPRTLQLPHRLARRRRAPASGPPPRRRGAGARALGRKTSQPLGAGARAEARRGRPQGHLAGRGKPSEGPSVRSGEGEAKCGQGACAVRRHKRLRGSPGHAR